MLPASLRVGARAFLLLGLISAVTLAWGDSSSSPAAIEIFSSSPVFEDTPSRWAVYLGPRPLGVTEGREHELPVEFRWDFGDGKGVITTGERTSLAYSYEDDGERTVRVEAWSGGALWAAGTKSVTVRNRRPFEIRLSAVEVDPDSSTFEITADADDTAADILAYDWDFGDGSSATGADRWRVEHAYPVPGTYTVTVTVSDDHGEEGQRSESLEITSYAAGESAGDTVDPLPEGPDAEGVVTRFDADIGGSLATDFDGEVRPFAGIFLGPLDDGERCRFMFTAWDDTKLAYVTMIADLEGLPSSGGARYTFKRPRVSINYSESIDTYDSEHRVATMGPGGLGLGEALADTFGELTPTLRALTKELAGVDPRARKEGPVQGAPPASSPFGLDDDESFTATGGLLTLDFYPRDRAVGSFDFDLQNTDERSPHQQLSMRGEISIDLEAAQRDGMVLYRHCAPAEFGIFGVSPSPGARFVYSRTPRVTVWFTSEYDVDLLDASTFQLTYPAADSGEPIPVEARLFRSESSAFLEPVEPLWGGVRYTARIKTGLLGVRGRNGAALEDTDESGWYSWDFTTRIELDSRPGETQHISCHVFQSVRDAPLIADKAAVARVYAHWNPDPRVHETAQEVSLEARVLLRNGQEEIASLEHEFVRPDLWPNTGSVLRDASHTANIYWRPGNDLPETLEVQIALPEAPGEPFRAKHWTRCATPSWPLRPTLELAPFLIVKSGWKSPDYPGDALDSVTELTGVAAMVAEQMLPVAQVRVRPAQLLHLVDQADETMILKAMSWQPPDPDLVLAFVPVGKGIYSTGPYAGPVAIEAVDFDNTLLSAHPIVRHLAYAVGLRNGPHLPTAAGLQPGIEGFRIYDPEAQARLLPKLSGGVSGFQGANKSSTEGNGEAERLLPLMSPADHPVRELFIARHQYFAAMEWLQDNSPIEP